MCTECFNKVSQFNDTKNTWIENQLRLDNSVIEDETSIKDEEVLHEPDIETQDESFEIADDGEYEYPVEYIDELQFDVDSVTVDEEQEVENEKSSLHKTRKKTKKLSGFKKEKGKVLYQKLLQKCAKCSKMVEKNRMEGHLNKHNDVRPYFCNNEGCGKTFYCKLLLRLHQKSMHTGRSIVCEVCNKTFPSERSLYSHSMRHKNRVNDFLYFFYFKIKLTFFWGHQDRYNCTYCEKKFNNTNSLKRHLAIHSGVREFSCDYCSSSFYRKFNLDVHIKCCHNKDKSYLCNLCPKKFGYSRLLRDHVRRVHGEGAEVQDEEFLMTEVVEI